MTFSELLNHRTGDRITVGFTGAVPALVGSLTAVHHDCLVLAGRPSGDAHGRACLHFVPFAAVRFVRPELEQDA